MAKKLYKVILNNFSNLWNNPKKATIGKKYSLWNKTQREFSIILFPLENRLYINESLINRLRQLVSEHLSGGKSYPNVVKRCLTKLIEWNNLPR